MSPELIAYLLSWAVFYTSYDMPHALPTVEVVEHQYFVQTLCKGVDSRRKPCSVRGSYDDNNTGVIRLNSKYYVEGSGDTKGVVLHEMIHYLQDLEGSWKGMEHWEELIRCQERSFREREAYLVQKKYLDDVHGITLIQRSKFDRCEKNYE